MKKNFDIEESDIDTTQLVGTGKKKQPAIGKNKTPIIPGQYVNIGKEEKGKKNSTLLL